MTEQIIQQIKKLFSAVDVRDWQKAMSVMDDSVRLDYSSMNGNPPADLSPRQITDAWAAFLPGFDQTKHQVSGFKMQALSVTATVHFKGEAQHWIGSESWGVTGTYEVILSRSDETWLITSMKFNFESQSGNTALPELAQERIKK